MQRKGQIHKRKFSTISKDTCVQELLECEPWTSLSSLLRLNS